MMARPDDLPAGLRRIWQEPFEIGKRPKVRETMLSVALPVEKLNFAALEKREQCKSANLEKATWRFRLSDLAAWE